MSFRDLNYYDEYVSHNMNVVKEFYIPVLNNAINFDRAVGYFRSNFIIEISKGLNGLIRNRGKMRIITSTDLTYEDLQLIEKGYSLKEICKNRLVDNLYVPVNEYELERYNYVSTLIEYGLLDIKIAIPKHARNMGIFHEKWGIIRDLDGNKISMVGSNNDTYSAVHNNSESFEINRSWIAESDLNKITTKEERFERMWNNKESGLIVDDVPNEFFEKLRDYKRDNMHDEDKLEDYISNSLADIVKDKNASYDKLPYRVPDSISIRDYQNAAYNEWKNNGYKGIFSMATGTGKTITAIYSMVELVKSFNGAFFVIVCPLQHLVEQWVEDLVEFGFNPVIGYSSSSQRKWAGDLHTKINLYNSEKIDCVTFVTTNDTFNTTFVQDMLSKNQDNMVLIVDEAHNIGAEKNLAKLDDRFQYRLALSATINRKYDEAGTNKIIDYFGGVVYSISIEEAIYEKKCLVEYEYKPVFCVLDEFEFSDYINYSETISKNTYVSKNGKTIMNNLAKEAANHRAQLIAGLNSKVAKLLEFKKDIKNNKKSLIYCGATTYGDSYVESDRQIDYIRQQLLENNVTVAKFTATENMKTRKAIKENFMNEDIDAIVAIKCLDEGVNIPCIETAYILASSKDEKQYIQRRGRVLRKFEKYDYVKEKAIIYDFIALPYMVDYAIKRTPKEEKVGSRLVKSEFERVLYFWKSAQNKSKIKDEILEVVKLYNGEIEHEIK